MVGSQDDDALQPMLLAALADRSSRVREFAETPALERGNTTVRALLARLAADPDETDMFYWLATRTPLPAWRVREPVPEFAAPITAAATAIDSEFRRTLTTGD